VSTGIKARRAWSQDVRYPDSLLATNARADQRIIHRIASAYVVLVGPGWACVIGSLGNRLDREFWRSVSEVPTRHARRGRTYAHYCIELQGKQLSGKGID